MNKKLRLFGVALMTSIFLLNLASAGYSYYYPKSYYSYPSYNQESQQEIFPKYYNAPTIADRTANSDFAGASFNRNYQGPILERTTRYDEFTKIGKSGRLLRTVSATTSERYVGASESESRASESRSQNARDYISTPQNPTLYDGGSFWRNKESFNYDVYGSNSYTRPYYYAPRYDSSGYYNWRY